MQRIEAGLYLPRFSGTFWYAVDTLLELKGCLVLHISKYLEFSWRSQKKSNNIIQCTAVTARVNDWISALPPDSREVDTPREMSNKFVARKIFVLVIYLFVLSWQR